MVDPFLTALRISNPARWLSFAVFAGALAYIFCALLIGILHVFYPFELEWMEGGMVDHIARIQSGAALYAEPAPAFVAYSYTPLYLHLSAGLAAWLGWEGFVAPRAISLASTMGCLLALYVYASRRSGSRLAGLLAAGLFAALFKLGGAWFAVARSDMLFLLFSLAGILLLSGRERLWACVLSGIFFALAFFTKQTALAIAAAMAVYTLIFFRGANRLAMPAVFGILVFAGMRWLDASSGGWARFYIFELASYHHLVLFRAFSFWVKDLVSPLFISITACALYALYLFRQGRGKECGFMVFALAGLVGSSFLVRTRAGSFANTVLPAYLGICLFAGVAFPALRSCFGQADKNNSAGLVVLFATLAQLLALFYDPTSVLPTAGDRAAGEHLIRVARSFDGEVLIPSHGYYATLAGKKPFAQQVAIDDINRCNRAEIKDPFFEKIRQELSSGRWEAVILNEPWPYGGMDRYEYRGDVFDNDEDFWPVTGRSMRPKSLYVRKD